MRPSLIWHKNERNIRLLIFLIAILTIAIALAVLPQRWWRIGLISESLWYLAVLWFLINYRPLWIQCARLPTRYIVVIALFSVGFLGGQYLGGGRLTYPFVRWAMYTDQIARPTYHIYVGVLDSGERVLLHPEQLFSSLRNGKIQSLLRSALKQMAEKKKNENLHIGSTELDGLLNAMATVWNEGKRGSPILAIEVFEVSALANNWSNQPEIQQQLLWRSEL